MLGVFTRPLADARAGAFASFRVFFFDNSSSSYMRTCPPSVYSAHICCIYVVLVSLTQLVVLFAYVIFLRLSQVDLREMHEAQANPPVGPESADGARVLGWRSSLRQVSCS